MLDIPLEIDRISVSDAKACRVEDCMNLLSHTTKSLNILTQNIRSISRNFDSFAVLLSRLKVKCDIIVLTECWLSCNPTLPRLDGYDCHTTVKCMNQNDGVAVFIRRNLCASVEESICQQCNCLLIKIGSDTAIAAVYRSPSNKNVDNFIGSLNAILTSLTSYKNICVIGDININICNDSYDARSYDYLNLCSFHGLLPAHTLPTRDKSCLDHVILKTKNPAITLVINSSITDHDTVLLSLIVKPNRIFSFDTIRKLNSEGLKTDLGKLDLCPVYSSSDVNDSVNYLITSIQSCIDANTVVVNLTKRNRIIKPWITPGLLRCMKHRDNLHLKLKCSPDDITLKITYKRYRNFCNSLLKKIKVAYEKTQLQLAGKNKNKIWETINQITHRTNNKKNTSKALINQTCPQDSVNAVNDFFVTIGQNLALKIMSNPGFDHTNQQQSINTCLTSFVLNSTDEAEVERLIMGLKSVCSVGWDNISNSFLKKYRHILIQPLTHIFNKCLTDGVFPIALKKSMVHAVYKSGNKNYVNNYRPISILPSISKLLERIINTRLINYLETNNLLSPNQYGFRHKKSTNDAVHELVDFIVTNNDKGNKTIGIFLDLAKAFDTVSIPLLIKKLENFGIRGKQIKLFEDYLTDRSQSVKIDEHISCTLPITYGVPQGSILGPTLFLAYLNDLCGLNLPQGKIISYADDTALIFSAKTWEEAYMAAQAGFDNIRQWLTRNVLSLNTDKTNYVTFSARNCDIFTSNLNILIHNCSDLRLCSCPPLNKTNCLKYLGIMLDSRMSFKEHINITCSRLRKLLYVFKNLRHVADYELIKQVYYALAQSLLEYCVTVWGGAPKTILKPLEIVQRAILKVSTFRPILFPTQLLYHSCGVLTVRQLYILKLILRQHSFTYYDKSFLSTKRRNDRICFYKQRPKHSYTQRFFFFLGPYLYNKLNKLLNIYPLNSNECKSKLTTFLKTLSYDETEQLLHT